MPDISAILSEMTLEEKAALCTGASAWTTTPMERLEVPEMLVSDGPHGLRRILDVQSLGAKSLPATCFPAACTLAATWNRDLMEEMGRALGRESLAQGVDVLLGPAVNMKRSPLCGRNFEYFSEDPFLAGELAASLVNGIQSQGVGTSLKHFAVNNQEYQRFRLNAIVDERSLHEIYLPAFEKVVKSARPWTVMCAYNKVNGTYASEHRQLLTGILREAWGFEGLVVSDWGAVHDRPVALRAGLDWQMPGPRPNDVQAVVDAVSSGDLDEAVLDESVRRILRIVFKAAETPKDGSFDETAHSDLAYRVARAGMVLLKNDGLLPLESPQRIAVIGWAAKHAHFQGGGSSNVNPTRVAVPFDALQARAGDAELVYAEGYPEDESFDQARIDQAVEAARSAEIVLLYIALPASKESEAYDRPDMDLTAQQVALIQAVCAAQPRSAVILHNGSPIAMRSWIAGPAAILAAGMMGQSGGRAIADILFGHYNPCGKLAETYPLKLSDNPSYLNFPGANGEVRYGEGIFIGYRYYDKKEMAVEFPFGFGLSYTTFDYGNMEVSAKTVKDTDRLTVSVEVTNTGDRPGAEIVQLYVHDRQSRLPRPPKELKGFARVELQPRETKAIQFQLDFRSFAYYHPGYQRWITESGEFDILIGASSADIRCRETIALESQLDLPSLLDHESSIREWLEDTRGRPIIAPVFEKIQGGSAEIFGSADGEDGDIGMDMTGFLMETPLRDILIFQERALGTPAREVLQSLLDQLAAAKAGH